MQSTNHILMIRPVNFKFNEQTAGNNKFQQNTTDNDVQQLALQEFDDFAALLRENGVDLTVVEDTLTPETPDSIFPNNWISFHENAEVFLYPMFSENRRLERRKEIIAKLGERFNVELITDLSSYESQNIFLEGTGSMVLDRENKLAYACLSLRTEEQVLKDWCKISGYTSVSFKADDQDGFPIYHTNVMMCIGGRFAVICLESIQNYHEREMVMQHLIHTGKEIIEISLSQMNQFAGNMLEVRNNKGERLLILSKQAYSSLTQIQIMLLEKYCRLVYSPLDVIEKNGGGSARCMLAEIHLKEK